MIYGLKRPLDRNCTDNLLTGVTGWFTPNVPDAQNKSMKKKRKLDSSSGYGPAVEPSIERC